MHLTVESHRLVGAELCRSAVTSYFFLSLFVGLIGHELFLIYFYRDPFPNWDHVNVVAFLREAPSFVDFFGFYDNEHLPYVPMIIWWVDQFFFGSPQYLSHVISILAVALSFGMVGYWRWIPGMPKIVALTGMLSLGLSPLHYENLVWPKQLHVHFSLLFSIFALHSFSRVQLGSSSYKKHLWLGLASAIASTFSFGWGLMVWPCITLYFLIKRNWEISALLITLSILVFVIYFFAVPDFHGSKSVGHFFSFEDVNRVLRFVGMYLGRQFGFMSVFVGLVLVVASVWLIELSWRSDEVDVQFLCLIVIFCLLSAFSTAVARSSVSVGDDPRYMIIGALFVAALLGLISYRITQLSSLDSAVSLVIRICFPLLVLYLVVVGYLLGVPQMTLRNFEIRRAAILTDLGIDRGPNGANALQWGVRDKDLWQANKMSVDTLFGDISPFLILGQKISETPIRNHACSGRVVEKKRFSESGREFLAIRGVVDSERDLKSDFVFIVDSSLKVVGLGALGFSGLESRKLVCVLCVPPQRYSGFDAVVPLLSGDLYEYSLYLKEGEDSLCRLGGIN